MISLSLDDDVVNYGWLYYLNIFSLKIESLEEECVKRFTRMFIGLWYVQSSSIGQTIMFMVDQFEKTRIWKWLLLENVVPDPVSHDA